MLTPTDERSGRPGAVALRAAALSGGLTPAETAVVEASPRTSKRIDLSRVLRIEWIGQTAASLCWIASVLAYGITSTGDWLQLAAASAWFLANVAAALATEAD